MPSHFAITKTHRCDARDKDIFFDTKKFLYIRGNKGVIITCIK